MAERRDQRDLGHRTAEMLRDVAAGAWYDITTHGEVVAHRTPPGARPALRIRPPRVHGGFAELKTSTTTESTAPVWDDLRGER